MFAKVTPKKKESETLQKLSERLHEKIPSLSKVEESKKILDICKFNGN
jgi:hypothetical protein